mgnify:CR=1 FL=1
MTLLGYLMEGLDLVSVDLNPEGMSVLGGQYFASYPRFPAIVSE